MFDPVAVVGSVGTTAGLISFVANTAGKLHDRKIEWEDCKELLAWYRAQYDTTYLQLRCWRNTWCAEDYTRPDSAYSYFWGSDGVKAVTERIAGICSEDEKIRRLLFCESIDMPESPQGSLESLRDDPCWTEWQHHLKNLVSCRNSQPRPEHWMSRFCFALYKHSDIQTRIGRLKAKVEDLETFSRLTFWTLQGREDTGSQVISENLSRLYRVRRAMGRLDRFLVALGTDELPKKQWALILGRPALSESLISFEEDHVLTLEFLVEPQVFISNDCTIYLVHIDCPLIEAELGDLKNLKEIISLPTGTTQPASQAMKGFLEQTMMEDKPRKAGLLLRAMVASKLVDSLIICYGTPYMRGLCTCGIRATHPADEEKFWTFRAVHGSHHCHDQGLQDRGFVLLAVALAELAISSPINILQPTPEEFEFQLKSAGGLKTLTPAKLLREISHRSGHPYQRAVEYCFEMDRKLMSREIRPEDFPRCKDRISRPVREFAEKVKQENEEVRQEPWYRNLKARYNL